MANKLETVYWVAGLYAPILHSVMVEATPKVFRIPEDRRVSGIMLPGDVDQVRRDAGVVFPTALEAWGSFVDERREAPAVPTLLSIAEQAFEHYKAKRESDFDNDGEG